MKNYTIPSLIIGAAIIISSVIIAGALDETYSIVGAGDATGYRLNLETGEVVYLYEKGIYPMSWRVGVPEQN